MNASAPCFGIFFSIAAAPENCRDFMRLNTQYAAKTKNQHPGKIYANTP
jgi:hypothetical protein